MESYSDLYRVSENTARLVHAYDTITAGIGEMLNVIEEMYGEQQEEVLKEQVPTLDEFQANLLAVIGCSIQASRARVGSDLI